MTVPTDMGGDPPCWSHLVEPPDRDLRDSADIEQLVRAFKALRRLLVGESASPHCPVEVALVHPESL